MLIVATRAGCSMGHTISCGCNPCQAYILYELLKVMALEAGKNNSRPLSEWGTVLTNERVRIVDYDAA